MSGHLPEPTHGEIQDLLGVYALDAVDHDTADMVERHLETCVRCSAEVAQHHEVAGLLANSGEASPAKLWDGISSQLDGSTPPSWERLSARLETGSDRTELVDRMEAGAGPVAPSPDTSADTTVVPITAGRRRNRWVARAAGAVAAAAVVVAIGLGAQVNHLNHQVSALQAPSTLSVAEQAALDAPSTRRVPLTAPSGSGGTRLTAAVTVILTRSGTGFVEARGLSSLPADKTYQLWGVVDGKTISLGLMGSAPTVVPFSVAGGRGVNAFAITAERAGGVVQSSNQPVVAGEVDA